jgi:hypothetical protein
MGQLKIRGFGPNHFTGKGGIETRLFYWERRDFREISSMGKEGFITWRKRR